MNATTTKPASWLDSTAEATSDRSVTYKTEASSPALEAAVAAARRLAHARVSSRRRLLKESVEAREEATWTSPGDMEHGGAVEILQRWDGVVLDVGEETFRARLLDEATGRPRVEAEIYISDVAEHDRPLLQKNNVFFWHMGYRDPHGDRERFSRIRMRRLPPKTDLDLKRAERRARERRKHLGWQ